MIYFPNAKINLGLNIVSKRPDGYHNLETIFYPIMIEDALEVIPSKSEDAFNQRGLEVGGSIEDNLVMKALMIMRQHYNFPQVSIELLKKIPFGAGIGGGSADAAFMLRLLNDMFDLKASDVQLTTLARQLGADCPFFIYNRPLFASGIGEIFEDVDLSLEGYYIALIKPEIHVATKDAFSLIRPQQPSMSLKDIVRKPIDEWRGLMHNDFEYSIFPQYPIISAIKTELYTMGAIYASMSGSGSSIYAIFREDLGSQIKTIFKDCYVWFGKANF